ncbi:MAG: peptide-N4-asparagine amidase [Candidatus Lutacidiplasmatales archaeon]
MAAWPPPPSGETHQVGVVPSEYVNLSDLASNWTSDFESVAWPTGTFSAIELELTLTNYGDPWDRAEWVDLNNVTLMDVTTLENSSNNNRVQSFSANLTEYESLFAAPGHIWWAAMPNWISPCDAKSTGCWSAVLSFHFERGPTPPGLPSVVPILPFATLSRAAPAVNGTLRVPGSFSRAEAVVFQEGQSNDEFWYAQPFASRELLWQWNNQTVLAVLPIPFINSGGALGGTNDLAEWNGTPAPGTGARPAVTADLTPWLGLLGQNPWYNFTVVDNGDYWQIGLAMFLWAATDHRSPGASEGSVNDTLGSRSGHIEGSSHANFTEPFALEEYNLSWAQFLNTSGSSFYLATVQSATDRVASTSVTLSRVSTVQTVFDVRVDSSGAVHIDDLVNWSNTTRVEGNGQNATVSELGWEAWTIDGTTGGLASTEHWSSTGSSRGNYSAPTSAFAGAWGFFENRTSKNGVGSSSPRTHTASGEPPVALPGRFVVAPADEALVRGPLLVDVLTSPVCAGTSAVTFGDENLSVPSNDAVVVNVPSLPNGTYLLNVSTPTPLGPSQVALTIRVTGWEPPYVSPLIVNASDSADAGEVPWLASFSGAGQGGTPPYSLAWTFGDGGVANVTNATHRYTTTGNFAVRITATDAAGRTAHADLTVQVFPALSVRLESASVRWTEGVQTIVRANVSGGDGPMNYSWEPRPTGCRVATQDVLSCAPSALGAVDVQLTVTDALGYSAAAQFNATVLPPRSVDTGTGGPLLLTGGVTLGASALAVAGIVRWRYRGKRRRSG